MGSGGHSTFIPWKVPEPCLSGSNPGRHFVEMRFFLLATSRNSKASNLTLSSVVGEQKLTRKPSNQEVCSLGDHPLLRLVSPPVQWPSLHRL